MTKKLESEYEKRARLKYAKFIFTRKGVIVFCSVIFAFLFTIFLRPWYQNVVNRALGYNAWQAKITYGDLQVHIIDVGQGDAIAIRFPDDRTLLIDAGQEVESGKLIKYLNNVFFENNKKIFNYVLLTHSDSDHCGGMAKVYQNFSVQCSLRPITYSTISNFEEPKFDIDVNISDNLYYSNYIDAIYGENSTVLYVSSQINYKIFPNGYICGRDSNNNEYKVIFLTNNKNHYSNINDSSSVVLIQYLGQNLLFAGDAESEGFDEIDEALLYLGIEKVCFYKASHHGSKTNDCNRTSTLFSINPEYVAVSVGKDNAYGHPHQAFIDDLHLINLDDNHILRTDIDDSIIFAVKSNAEILAVKGVQRAMMLEYVWELTYLLVIIIAYVLCFYNRKRIKEDEEENVF